MKILKQTRMMEEWSKAWRIDYNEEGSTTKSYK